MSRNSPGVDFGTKLMGDMIRLSIEMVLKGPATLPNSTSSVSFLIIKSGCLLAEPWFFEVRWFLLPWNGILKPWVKPSESSFLSVLLGYRSSHFCKFFMLTGVLAMVDRE